MKPIEQYLKDNHFTAIESLKGGYCLDGKDGNLYTRLLNAMEEMLVDVYNEAIDDCISNAEIEKYDEHMQYSPSINEQSILKLKK